ncbi:C-14 sterol reductase [Neofusicoccum parvum]|nr:C-14 sterol reductase [Neofusicoccum parvum]
MTNRRDSDIVRQALASPRIALERKDPNSPSMANVASPTRKGKSKESERASDMTALDGKKLDLSDMTEDLTLEKPAPAPAESSETTSNAQNTRRSSRARQTRLPATPSVSNAGPNRIQFRRADGTDPVVLKKTEAQELANLTRNNTRRNKGTALAAPIRLNKLKAESLKADASPGAPSPNGPVPIYANPEIEVYQASKLRWDQQLVYFQEQDNLAGLTSLSDDELAGPAETPVQEPAGKKEDRKRKDKSSTSTPARTKRARGLGAGNGTPAKGLLAPASLLPAEVQAETLETESSKTSGKKPSTSTKSSASTRARKADNPTPTPPAPTASSPSDGSSSSKIPSPSSSAEQPSSSNAPPPPMETSTAQPAPSQLPTPSSIGQSRRSRLQTPRRVKLPVPVPVPVSAAAAAASTPGPTAPAAAQAQAQSASRIIGLTPKKMPVAKPAGSTGGPEVGGGNGGQGLSAGRRRAGAGRRP